MFTHILAADNGRIYSKFASPQATILVDGDSVDPSTHWYDWQERAAKLKEAMPITVTPEAITGAPCKCSVSVSGPLSHTFQIDEQDTPVSFVVPGEYTIVVTPDVPKWLPYEGVLNIAPTEFGL